MKLHKRARLRLADHDYTSSDQYFITICCKDGKHRFGEIVEREMMLNELGVIAEREWLKLSQRFGNVELDILQVMPNHTHAIIGLTSLVPGMIQGSNPLQTQSLIDIIRSYKSIVAVECLRSYKAEHKILGKLWQRNYYEHLIRDHRAYVNIANYIIDNPARWEKKGWSF